LQLQGVVAHLKEESKVAKRAASITKKQTQKRLKSLSGKVIHVQNYKMNLAAEREENMDLETGIGQVREDLEAAEELLARVQAKARAATNSLNAARPRAAASPQQPMMGPLLPEDAKKAFRQHRNKVNYNKNQILNVLNGSCGGDPEVIRDVLLQLFKTEAVKQALADDNDPMVALMAIEFVSNVKEVLALLKQHLARREQWQAYQSIMSAVVPENWRDSQFNAEQWRKLIRTSKKALRSAQLRRRAAMSDSSQPLHVSNRKQRRDAKLSDSKYIKAVEKW
jgi:hypothetical protein